MFSRTLLLTAVLSLALGCGGKPTAPTPAPLVFQTIAELNLPTPFRRGPRFWPNRSRSRLEEPSITSGSGGRRPTARLPSRERYTSSTGSTSQATSDVYPGGDLYFSGSLRGGDTSYVRAFIVSQSDRLDAGFTLRGVRVQ